MRPAAAPRRRRPASGPAARWRTCSERIEGGCRREVEQDRIDRPAAVDDLDGRAGLALRTRGSSPPGTARSCPGSSDTSSPWRCPASRAMSSTLAPSKPLATITAARRRSPARACAPPGGDRARRLMPAGFSSLTHGRHSGISSAALPLFPPLSNVAADCPLAAARKNCTKPFRFLIDPRRRQRHHRMTERNGFVLTNGESHDLPYPRTRPRRGRRRLRDRRLGPDPRRPLDSGRLSEAAFQQLIVSTGLTPQEARGLTLDEIVAIRWQDD